MTTDDTTTQPATPARHQTIVHAGEGAQAQAPTPAPTPAEVALAAALRAVDEARAALAREQAERARAVKIARINARIDRELDALVARMNAIQARMMQLERRRPGVMREQAGESRAQGTSEPGDTTREPAADGTRSYKTPRYLFHSAFQKRYKGTGATQRSVTATCTAHHIDPADRSPENLARCYEIMLAEKTIMVAR